jgi:coproporphyrinogen III oxidase-like Fe-S oxidoreductase
MTKLNHKIVALGIIENLAGEGKDYIGAVHKHAFEIKNMPLASASNLMLNMPDNLFLSQFGADIVRNKSDSHGMPTYPTSKSWQSIKQETIFNTEKNGNNTSLYVHIPFCESTCSYCHYIKTDKSTENINRYIDALSKELDLLSQKAPSRLSSVYIGGGTPSILPTHSIRQLLSSINENFVIDSDTDFTFEASPVTLQLDDGYDKMSLLKEFNVNRVSMGVQTFDQAILKICNREQTLEQVWEAIQLINRIGIETTDADLIIGLPHQTLPQIEHDVNQLISLGLDEITIHPLGLKTDSRLYSYFQRYPLAFPSREVKFLSILFADAILNKSGFVSYLPKHYGKPNRERFIYEKYRRIYNSNLLAAGLSASGFYNGFQYGNSAVFNDYIDTISQNKLPITKGIKVDGNETMRRFIIMHIRTLEGINIDEFMRVFGVLPNTVFEKELSLLNSLGLMQRENGHIKCTNIGKFFTDFAAYQFISKQN